MWQLWSPRCDVFGDAPQASRHQMLPAVGWSQSKKLPWDLSFRGQPRVTSDPWMGKMATWISGIVRVVFLLLRGTMVSVVLGAFCSLQAWFGASCFSVLPKKHQQCFLCHGLILVCSGDRRKEGMGKKEAEKCPEVGWICIKIQPSAGNPDVRNWKLNLNW